MRGLSPMQRAALLLAGAVLGIAFSGTVTAWLARAHINEARPLPPAKGEPAPEPRAGAAPPSPPPA
jgi:hypothetical protein